MRAPPAGEVGLGDDRHLGVRQRAAAVQRGDDDAAARARESVVAGLDDGEVEPVVEQQLVQALRRALSVGGDDDAVLLGEQLAEPLRQPARRRRRPGPTRTPRRPACRATPASSRSSRTSRSREQRIGRRRAGAGTSCRDRVPTSRRAPWRGRPPRRAARSPGRASGAARPARPWRARGRTSVSNRSSSTSHGSHDSMPSKCSAFGEALPLLAPPRLGGDQLVGAAADVVASASARGPGRSSPRRGRPSSAGR